MRIEKLQTACYRLPLPRVLSDSTHGDISHFQLVTVQIEANGECGLGYTYTVGQGGTAIRALIEHDLEPLLLNADASEIQVLWNRMWGRLHYVGRGGLASFAISAVDVALWDLAARCRGLPLWRFLGGTDPKVPAYAGGIDLQFSTEELLEQCDAFLNHGFRAIKMKVGREDLQQDVTRVAAMRERLGSEVPLMVDANMAWSVEEAITAAQALRPHGIYWLEEPTAPDDFPGHAQIAEQGGVPIAAGENLHTLREFQMLVTAGGAAFPEPDVANIGGVTAWIKVAELARANGLPVTSHGVHDLHVHLLSAVPNSSFLECHAFGLEAYMEDPLPIVEGNAVAPDRSGHGVSLRWKSLESYRHR